MKNGMKALIVLAVLAWPASAQQTANGVAAGANIETGQALYERYCATCHGLDADGKGPMAPALVLQPTDLTQLAARNDGAFPLLRIVRRIDGRDPLVSHGSPMPVFGDFFEGGRNVALKTEAGQPIMTSTPVADLIAWLETIQK